MRPFSLPADYQEKLANNKEIILKIKVFPQAEKTGFRGEMADGALKIGVAAAPENNRANAALIKYLASELGLAQSQVKILSGASSRLKIIKAKI